MASGLMTCSLLFANRIGFGHSEVLGYTIIVLSFLLVFFGIRSYRDNVGGGRITFGHAFLIGISITLISCICYVVTWEILYYKFMPDFFDKYAAYMVRKMQNSGATPAAIQEKMEGMKKLRKIYDNPLGNALMTFLEPFPVGLIVSLLSSAVLKKKAAGASSHA